MKPDEEFHQLLNNARTIEDFVAVYLEINGFSVFHLPSTTTPDRERRFKHTDNGDLLILLPTGDPARVEVKASTRYNFESPFDLPFPGITVDEAYKIEKANTFPLLCYIIVNRSQTGAFFIWNYTKKDWFVRTFRDGREGDFKDYCLCPKELAMFQFFYEAFAIPDEPEKRGTNLTAGEHDQ